MASKTDRTPVSLLRTVRHTEYWTVSRARIEGKVALNCELSANLRNYKLISCGPVH